MLALCCFGISLHHLRRSEPVAPIDDPSVEDPPRFNGYKIEMRSKDSYGPD